MCCLTRSRWQTSRGEGKEGVLPGASRSLARGGFPSCRCLLGHTYVRTYDHSKERPARTCVEKEGGGGSGEWERRAAQRGAARRAYFSFFTHVLPPSALLTLPRVVRPAVRSFPFFRTRTSLPRSLRQLQSWNASRAERSERSSRRVEDRPRKFFDRRRVPNYWLATPPGCERDLSEEGEWA